MNEYKLSLKNPTIAEKIDTLTRKYEEDLIETLSEIKELESEEDFNKCGLAVGHVLATFAQTLFNPIYRKHPHLIPPELKSCFESESPDASGE